MRRLLPLTLMFALSAYAQTITPNLDLQLDNPGSVNWGLTTNANFSSVDTAFSLGQCGDATHAVGFNATTRRLFCQSIPGTAVSILPIANGGTGTSTPGLIAGANITITGAWPNQTINSSGGGGSPAFSVVTAGTNTSALLVGTGGSLGVTGSGTIDSTTLLGGTWASPGGIGTTTPGTGAFTSLSSTTTGTFNNLTVTGTCTGCSGTTTAFASVTAGTNTAALLVGTGGSLAATGSGTIAATTFLGLTAGTSGGVPYFSGASTLASSAALTANLPIVGGGAGVAPVSGSRTGNTTQFASWTGATTGSRCVDTDASGNLHITSTDCNVGAVTSVGQSFTGGIISVAGSPITTSGTFALTIAGVSGGIPYFTSSSAWASSALLTANALMKGGGIATAPSTSAVTEVAGVLATNADLVSIAPSATSANGALSVAPTATGTPAIISNCANGLTVDCFDVNINGVKQFFIDLNGKTNLQPSSTTSASFNISTASAALPTSPVAGDVALVGNQMTYYDSSVNQENVAASGVSTTFTQQQNFVAPNASTTAVTIKAAATPTVDLFECLDSTGAVQCAIDKNFNLIVPVVKTNGSGAGQEGFGAGTDQGVITNQVSFSGPATLTGTGYDVALPGVEPTAGQVLTIGTCTTHLCTSSYATPGAGSGTVTSFSAGTLSPLFTTSVATSTTTPALTFTLSNAAAGTVFGNPTGSSAAPSFTTAPVVTSIGTGTPPSCTAGTGGVWCAGEGTAPTAASAVGQLYQDSTLHDWAAQVNGGVKKLVGSAIGYNSGSVSTSVGSTNIASSANFPTGQYLLNCDVVVTAVGSSPTLATTVGWTDISGTARTKTCTTGVVTVSDNPNTQTITSNGSAAITITQTLAVSTATWQTMAAITRLQ